jgi:hypothetical protein
VSSVLRHEKFVYSTRLLIGKINATRPAIPSGKLSGGLFTVSLKVMRRMHRTPKALPRARLEGSAKSGVVYFGEDVGVPPASTRRFWAGAPSPAIISVCQAFCEFA